VTDPTIVETAGGRVCGLRTASGLTFRGVPYGTAGSRFTAPGPARTWDADREAREPGAACPQPDRAVARFTHGDPPRLREDCLNLNIHTTSLDGARPVMVWLHGGGFAIGHASASLYDGARLAHDADAVVVTVNYRLGSFGWLCHPALAQEPGSPAGNWGLLDQIAALRWVQRNARAFGGDPRRVTVAGQSAGALSALDLLTAPLADGLFSRLILQSPPLADAVQPAEAGFAWAQALTRAAGAEDPRRLREVPAGELVALHEAVLEQPEFRGKRGALPTVDPATLPTSPLDTPGARPEVEILIGWTADEGTFFFDCPWRPAPDPQRIPGIVAHLTAATEPSELIDRYREHAAPGRDDDQALLVAIATDAMFAGPITSYARARVRTSTGRVFTYRFDHPGGGSRLRATHSSEVPLLFGTWRDGGAGERLGGQATGADEVARRLVGSWRGFLHGDGPGWASLTTGHDDVGVFGGDSPLHIEHDTANRITI